MSTIEFDDQTGREGSPDRLLYAKFQKSSQTPYIITLLIKNHIVKDEKGARKLLLAISLIIFIISMYFIIKSFNGPSFIDTVAKSAK